MQKPLPLGNYRFPFLGWYDRETNSNVAVFWGSYFDRYLPGCSIARNAQFPPHSRPKGNRCSIFSTFPGPVRASKARIALSAVPQRWRLPNYLPGESVHSGSHIFLWVVSQCISFRPRPPFTDSHRYQTSCGCASQSSPAVRGGRGYACCMFRVVLVSESPKVPAVDFPFIATTFC